MYWLILDKDRFKFSSSHFTIFSETDAERLHGHNYYVSLKLGFEKLDEETQMAVPFDQVKKDLKRVCDELDERVLLPMKSSFLKINKLKEASEIEVKFQKKRYVFPSEDVFLLELSNISSEALACWVGERFLSFFSAQSFGLQRLELKIEETKGQFVVWGWQP